MAELEGIIQKDDAHADHILQGKLAKRSISSKGDERRKNRISEFTSDLAEEDARGAIMNMEQAVLTDNVETVCNLVNSHIARFEKEVRRHGGVNACSLCVPHSNLLT